MQNQQTVAVAVNERNLLNNALRNAYSNHYTVVTELMQNARRAGSPEVRVQYDQLHKRLVVEDDGSGITDFQNLLTVAESGWGEEIKESETPFGVGFLACLYVSTHVKIESNGKTLAFDTSDALNFKTLAVEEGGSIQSGTRVTLEGIVLDDIAHRIKQLVTGFPVPVSFNGVHLDRPHSPDRLALVDLPIGQVYIHGVDTGSFAARTVCYLQGFRILDTDRRSHYSYVDHDKINVVHLDSTKFRARMPDRDVLIDAEKQAGVIHEAIAEYWRERLVEFKASLSGPVFLNTYFGALAQFGCVELANDVGFLPRAVLETIEEYPYQEGYGGADYLADVKRDISRAEVEKGEVVIVQMEDSINDENATAYMFAWKAGYILINSTQLDEGHWVQGWVRNLDAADIAIEVEGIKDTLAFEGWIWTRVAMCDSYTLTWQGRSITYEEDAVYDGDRIIYPLKEASAAVINQASSYIDGDDRYHEDDHDSDWKLFERMIANYRSTDEAQLMRNVLSRCDTPLSDLPALRGKSFIVHVQQDGTAVECLSDPSPTIQAVQSDVTRYVQGYLAEEQKRGNVTLPAEIDTLIANAISAFAGGAR